MLGVAADLQYSSPFWGKMDGNNNLDLFEILAEMPSLKDGDRRTLLKLASARRVDLALRNHPRESPANQALTTLPDTLAKNIGEIEEIRIQMVAVAAAARLGDVSVLGKYFNPESHDQRETINSNGAAQKFAIEQFGGGVRSCRIFDSTVILLPEPRSNLHCWQILNALNKLYLSTGRSRLWIIDCSAITGAEALIYSSLLGYQKSLRGEHEGIKLIWLSPDSLPPLIAEKMVETFRLERIGSHLFSR